MILQQILLFLAGLGFGIASRFVYVAVTKLEKAINLKVITIIFDILMTAAGVIAFTLMIFFINDGVFMPFIFVSACLGFVTVSILV